MFCKKCGYAMDDGMNFCPHCGEPAVEPIVQEAEPEEADAEHVVYEPAEAEPVTPPEPVVSETDGFQPVYPIQPTQPANVKAPTAARGLSGTTLQAVMFLLAACTMISMILSGVGISVKAVRGFGLSLTATAMNGIADDITAFGVYTVFLVIYIIISLCAVFMILNKNKYGTIAGIAANAVAVIFSIVEVIAAFALSKDAGGFISTFPTVWTWLALVLGLAGCAFLILKGRDLIT